MVKKRSRVRVEQSLQERLQQFTRSIRAAARQLPPGVERAELARRARDGEAAANIERWLSSPGLRKPK